MQTYRRRPENKHKQTPPIKKNANKHERKFADFRDENLTVESREAARREAARANQSPSLRRSPQRQGRDLHGSFRAAASSSAAADDDEGLDVDEPDTDAKPE